MHTTRTRLAYQSVKMKLLFALLVIGAASAQQWGGPGYGPRRVIPAPLANDGRVIDTPEIAQAKNAHFAAHDAVSRRPQFNQYNAAPYDDGSYRDDRYNDEGRYAGDNQRYTAPRENNYDDYSEPQQEKRWKGPFAKIEFTSDGKFIKETPEVAHARQQHLAALEHARKNNPSGGVGYEGDESYGGGQYREQEQYRQQPQHDNRGYNVNEGRNYQEDDGQYRGEGSAQYREGSPQYRPIPILGQSNQYSGRPQTYY